ncbi:hypothetical protein ZHAS_00017622 [Anopheles sinensis]|uniref:Uncharacterized protein n=1 Tax=Anopheles sinensis TaxID=74873 RepID=A0A084WGX4_ANOSI|nr:hypothetical protein ZHAS_00017622 [Anopheles sinensis]
MFVTAAADCESPDDDPCVDAVRDLAYCPPDNPVAPTEPVAPSPRKPPTGLPPTNRAPKAAPRTSQPPTPKPRSVLPTTTQLDSVQKSCDDDIDSSSSGAHSLDGVSSTDGDGGSSGVGPSFIHRTTSTSNKTMTLGRPTFSHTGGGSSSTPRNTLRLIPVDFSLFNVSTIRKRVVSIRLGLVETYNLGMLC